MSESKLNNDTEKKDCKIIKRVQYNYQKKCSNQEIKKNQYNNSIFPLIENQYNNSIFPLIENQ